VSWPSFFFFPDLVPFAFVKREKAKSLRPVGPVFFADFSLYRHAFLACGSGTRPQFCSEDVKHLFLSPPFPDPLPLLGLTRPRGRELLLQPHLFSDFSLLPLSPTLRSTLRNEERTFANPGPSRSSSGQRLHVFPTIPSPREPFSPSCVVSFTAVETRKFFLPDRCSPPSLIFSETGFPGFIAG